MATSNHSKGKYILGMIILAISGLLLGAVIGYFGSHFVLEKTVLHQMEKDGYKDTSVCTATSEDIVNGKAAYVNGELVNGTVIKFETSDATAKSEFILQGKTAYVDGELVVGTLQVIPASTITPSTTPTNLVGNVYLTGDIVIKGDANLKPANIKKGVSIFGVVGTYTVEAPQEGN